MNWIFRYKWLMVVGVVLLLAWAGYYYYWTIRHVESEQILIKTRQSDTKESLSPPVELSAEYDPSLNVAVFRVMEVEPVGGKVMLKYLWPNERAGEDISTVIFCPTWGSKIFDQGSNIPRYVTNATLLGVMAETPPERLLLQGRCADTDCSMINQDCQLTITQGVRNEE